MESVFLKHIAHSIFSFFRSSMTLYISIVFHYVFRNTPRGDRRIYLVVVSYYTALVSPAAFTTCTHTCSLRFEPSGYWFAVALSLRRRAPAPTEYILYSINISIVHHFYIISHFSESLT